MDSPKPKPTPKHLDPNYNKYKKSKAHEKRLGDRLGGKRLPRSGGVSWSKQDVSKVLGTNVTLDGDISAPTLHLEHKRTEKESIAVQKEWLAKVRDGARRTGKDPGVILTFERKNQKPEDWALVPLEVLERLLKIAESQS